MRGRQRKAHAPMQERVARSVALCRSLASANQVPQLRRLVAVCRNQSGHWRHVIESAHLSVCLSVCFTTTEFTVFRCCLSLYSSLYSSLYLSLYLSLYSSLYSSLYLLSIYLSIRLSIRLSICSLFVSIYLSICLCKFAAAAATLCGSYTRCWTLAQARGQGGGNAYTQRSANTPTSQYPSPPPHQNPHKGGGTVTWTLRRVLRPCVALKQPGNGRVCSIMICLVLAVA